MIKFLQALTAAAAVVVLPLTANAQITFSSPTIESSFAVGESLYISWTDETSTLSDDDGITISLSTDNGASYSELVSGSYSDFNGIYYWSPTLPPVTSEAVIKIENTTEVYSAESDVFSILAPEITVETGDATNCTTNDGYAYVNGVAFGVTYDVYYTLDGEAQGPLTLTADEGLNVSNLSPGAYTDFYVEFSETPSNSLSFTIGDSSAVVDEEVMIVVDPTAAGAVDGSIDAVEAFLYEGSGTLTYQWYEGSDTSTPIDGATGTSISGLGAGTYSFLVTISETGCTSNLASVTLYDPSTVTITSTDLTAGDIGAGTNDNLIYALTMTVEGGESFLEGFFLAFSATTYAEDDFIQFTLWEAVDLADFSQATVLKTTGFVYGDENIPDGAIGWYTNTSYPGGSTVYFYVTADVAEGATLGNEIKIDIPLSNQNFGFFNDPTLVDGGLSAGSTFTIADLTAPVVSVDTLYSQEFSPALSGTIDDANASITVLVNGTTADATNNGDGTWSTAFGAIGTLTEGIYDVVVTATDDAGNAGTDTTTNELVVDLTSPTVTVDELLTNLASPPITGTIDELAGSIEVTIGTETMPATQTTDTTWEVSAGSFAELAEGTYNVSVTAIDMAGNSAFDGSLNELTVDLTVPQATFEPFITTDPSPTLSGTVDDLSATIDVTVNDVVYDALSSLGVWSLAGGTIADLAVGSYTVTVSAYDEAGNTSSSIYEEGLVISGDSNLYITLDSTALLTIYDSMGGESWTRANNWRSGETLSNWTDVTFSDKGRVIGLDLSGNNLTGSFPKISQGLELIATLNITDNAITDIPDFSNFDSLTSVNVGNNRLEFDDLEANMDVTGFTYDSQREVGEETTVQVANGSDYQLSLPVGGSANTYTWVLINPESDTSVVAESSSDSYLIEGIAYETMGTYLLKITNELVPDLILESYPQQVSATADLTITALAADGTALSDGIGMVFQVSEGHAYDTIQQISPSLSQFVFEELVLGDYLIMVEGDLDTYLPTYYDGTDLWTAATVFQHRSDSSEELSMVSKPDPLPTLEDGGTIDGLVESDFTEENESGRIEARRTVKRAGCSMRRFVSKGRSEQEDGEYVLIAYVQSDDDGSFTFTDLEAGTYKFTVDYPGIPMDESSDIIFEIGEGNATNNSLSLKATIYDDKITVEVSEILGFTEKYFEELTVYPVPTSDYITISYNKLIREGMSLRIIDLQGKMLKEETIAVGYNKKINVDVTSIPAGIYLLNIVDGKSGKKTIATYRVVKQ